MLRSPAVAGQFYPGSEASLLKTLGTLVPEIQPEERKEALAVISPHAGYIYSGGVADKCHRMRRASRDRCIDRGGDRPSLARGSRDRPPRLARLRADR